jgi:hypothetical protein
MLFDELEKHFLDEADLGIDTRRGTGGSIIVAYPFEYHATVEIDYRDGYFEAVAVPPQEHRFELAVKRSVGRRFRLIVE